MSYTNPQQIGQRGEDLFKTLLPRNWQARKQDPDYHKDFYVEVFDGMRATGLEFICSIKTYEKAKYNRRKHIPWDLKTEHLRYYLENVRQPVFLVVVDLDAKRAFWVFLQRCARTLRKDWRKQKTVKVQVPARNDLHDSERLQKEVRLAWDFMHELHPGSIGSAMKAEKERLERLDPRVQVSITAEDGNVGYHISAKEGERFNVTLTLKGLPEDLALESEDLLARGHKVEFHACQVSVSGSRVFEEMLGQSEGTVVLQSSRTRSGQVIFVALGEDGDEVARTEPVPVLVGGGASVLSIRGQLPESPLAVEAEFDARRLDLSKPEVEFPVNITFDSSLWVGQHLMRLAYFEQINDFFKAAQNAGCWRLELWASGYLILRSLPSVDSMVGPNMLRCIEILDEAREIAAALAVDPILPRLTTRHMDEIERIYALLQTGACTVPGSGSRVQLTVNREGATKILDEVSRRCDACCPLSFSSDRLIDWAFLGNTVNIGPVVYSIDKVTLLNIDRLIEELKADGERDRFGIVFQGAADSRVTVRKAETQD